MRRQHCVLNGLEKKPKIQPVRHLPLWFRYGMNVSRRGSCPWCGGVEEVEPLRGGAYCKVVRSWEGITFGRD
jgi:hypothetical protein